jgi:hypothetical protein
LVARDDPARLAQLWRREFPTSLSEPGLTDTAATIHDEHPWSGGLWTDGW